MQKCTKGGMYEKEERKQASCAGPRFCYDSWMLAGCGNTASTTTDNGAADTTVTEATDDKTSTDTAKADMVKCLL